MSNWFVESAPSPSPSRPTPPQNQNQPLPASKPQMHLAVEDRPPTPPRLPPSSSLSPPPRRSSFGTAIPHSEPITELSEPESERRPHAHTEEGEEDGDSEADFANAEVSMNVHQMEDGVEEDKGALSDATTITLPRSGRSPSLSSLGSTDDSDDVSGSDSSNDSLESEDEVGDEDERGVSNARKVKKKVVPSSPPLLPSKSKLNQPRLHSHPRPKSKDKVKPFVKDREENKVQPKSGKSLSSPSDNHHVKAKAKRRDLSQAQSSRQRPDSSLSSIKDREKPGKKSVPVGIGAGLKGSKKRTKRIVSSSETEEDEVRVKKKLKEKEKKNEQKPSLPSAVNSEGAAPKETTPPPKSPRPLTPPPPLSFLPVKEPSPPPSAPEPKKPTPPPPEPPKKVSLSEYLKTHKFRKESQTPAPMADRVTSGSDSAAGSTAIPGLGDHLPPRSLSASADASKTEPVEHEKREGSNPPNPLVPTNISANVATSASTSGLNLFEHLPSSRVSAPGPALGLGSGDNSGLGLVNPSSPLSVVELSPAPVSATKNLDENDPLSSSAIATALSLASAITSATSRGQIVNHEASTGPTRPAMQSSTSTSYVPRQSQPQVQSTPSSATVSLPMPTSTSKDHFIHPLPLTPSIPPPPAPSSAATVAARVSSSYTPRQASSSSITSVGGVEESHSPQRGFTPLYGRRERERSPIRGDFRDRDRDRDWDRDRDRDRRPLTLSHRELPERPSTSTSISIPPPLTARDLPPHTSSTLSGTPSELGKTTGLGLGLPRAPPTGPKVPPTGPRAFSGSGAPGGGVETAASPSAAGALGSIGAGLGLSRGRGFRGFAPRGVWRGRGFRGRGRGG